MALETPEEIEQYLILEKKSTSDLKTLCEGMQLSPEGERRELITRLLATKVQPQTDFLTAQMIALRTRVHDKEIPGAEDFLKRVRKAIFEGKNNTADFSVLNGKNEPFTMKMRFAICSFQSLQFILDGDMIYPHAGQRELVKMIKKEPLIFKFHLVQRTYGKSKTFIMLHCQPKG